jgi:hypothetical protein
MKRMFGLILLGLSSLLHASGTFTINPAAARSGINLLPERYLTLFRPGQLHQSPQQLQQAIQNLANTGIQPTIIFTSSYERTVQAANLITAYFPGVPIVSIESLGQQNDESAAEYRSRVSPLLLEIAHSHARPLIIGHSHMVAAAYPNPQDFQSIADGGFVIATATYTSHLLSRGNPSSILILTVYHRFSNGVILNPPNTTQSFQQ